MHIAFFSVLVLYLIATLFYLLRLITAKTTLSAIGLRMVLLAMLMQAIVLFIHYVMSPHPLRFTYLEYFQLSALFLAIVFSLLCFTKKYYGSGPFFIILIDVFCIFSLTLENRYSVASSMPGYGYLLIHLICIFLSLSVFSLGLVTAIMFLLSERQIKLKRFEGIVAKFPSLAILDETHYRALYAGFVLFTFVIITGAGYSKIKTGHYLGSDLKQIVSILSWLFFAVILNFRVRQGWLGHKGILLSFVGLISMMFLFIVGL